MRQNIERAMELGPRLDDTETQDWLTLYAAVRCLEIISEASRRLTPDMLERHPHLPWRSIRDAGNVYRHMYDDLDFGEIRHLIRDDLPVLLEMIKSELKDQPV